MENRKRKAIIAALSWFQDQVIRIEETGATVKVIPDRIDSFFGEEIATADALIVGILPISGQVMEKASNLAIIAVQGVGYNTVDLRAADEFGIVVTNTPMVNSNAVAEFTLGLMLAITRRIPQGWAEMINGGWNRLNFSGTELKGKTLGILGFGQIGRRVGKLGTAFGMEVLAWDQVLDENVFKEAGAKPVSKEWAIQQADILSLHLPLTRETRDIIGARELAMMKPTSFLINTARGGLVNRDALMKALDEGILLGAAIDVFEQEPPQDRVLIEHPKILVTPHIAGFTEEARYRMGITAADQVVHALRGEKPPCQVNDPQNPRYEKLYTSPP
jgi:D-3-phosphoglycerate dehydrogenase